MLTSRQQIFAESIHRGISYSHTYRIAYKPTRMSSKTIWEAASIINEPQGCSKVK